MTDFEKWDKFDADAAEKEVERKAADEEKKRARVAEEQWALKCCQNRASRLKSEAVVRALKARRGSRRRPSTATNNNSELTGIPKDGPASLAKTSADEADVILKSLRRGLKLRDEAVADAEAGKLCQGICEARECLIELNTAQDLLRKAVATASGGGDDDDNRTVVQTGAHSSAGRTCCSHGEHDHSHAHAGTGNADGSGPGGHGKLAAVGVGAQADEEKGAKEDMLKVLNVLGQAKAACRVAEAACLLRGGRVADSTEALRELLFEDPKSVPAWVARGEAFLAMEAPLLAGLHFDRALDLDRGCAAAALHKESLPRLSLQPVATDRDPHTAPKWTPPYVSSQRSFEDASSSVKCGDSVRDQGKLVETANAVGMGTPAPAEDGAMFTSDATKQEEGGKPGVVTTQEAIASASGGGGDGKAKAAFRQAIAAACENYRAGMVLHQEAFLSSSRERFLRVLELLERVTTAQQNNGEVLALGTIGGDGELHNEDGFGGSEVSDRETKGASFEAEVGVVSSRGGTNDSRADGAAAVIRSMRVGCHLNIAASFLLRKTDFESAVFHCTRALAIDPGNSRALVRRAQAHQELGYFRLTVEDLEAAEASVSLAIRDFYPRVDGEEALKGELLEIVKRLEHARWTKVHVGNGKDELPRA